MRVVGTDSRKVSNSPTFCSYKDFFLTPVSGSCNMARISLAASGILDMIIYLIHNFISNYQTVGRGLVRGRWMFSSYLFPVWRRWWSRRCSSDRMVSTLQSPYWDGLQNIRSYYWQGLNSNYQSHFFYILIGFRIHWTSLGTDCTIQGASLYI